MVGYYGYRGSTYVYVYYYEAWHKLPLNIVDNKTYIDSATITIQTSGYNINQNVQAKFLSVDPTSAAAATVYNDIRSSSGAVIGTVYISRPGTYTYTFSQTGLTHLKDSIEAGDMHAYIGFAMTSEPSPPSNTGSFYHRQYLYPDRVSLNLKVDRDAPEVPTPTALPTWTIGTSVTMDWSTVADLPLGGNRSGVEYSARVQLYENGMWVTHRQSPWISTTTVTFDRLLDGGAYRAQVQSRDASDYQSAWSTAVNTTMDSSPPTTPVIEPLDDYTAGSTLSVNWSASTDAGIGLASGPPDEFPYELQWSTSPTFDTNWSADILGTSVIVSDLEDYTRYFYRVRAQDKGGQISEWSPVESTTLDDDPPSIPTIIEEAEYTQGTTNTFEWLASTDAGVGVKDYHVQVAHHSGFGAASIIVDTFAETASCDASGLADGVTYYCRVAARDHFDHESLWSQVTSSTQDASPPSAADVYPLPVYSPAGTIFLTWKRSSDEGAGMGWYKVLVSKDPDFGQIERTYDNVVDASLEHIEMGSHDQTLYLRVVPVDLVGNEGPPGDASTTMDIVAPEAPTIEPLPPYSPGNEITLSWSPSEDDGSGVYYYTVDVFLSEPSKGPIITHTTNGTSTMISGLADGVTYWYQVTAVDRAGNGNASALASSTQDASPPGVPTMDPLPEFVPGPDISVSWTPVTDASGHLV
ncbi:MAG: fibronectin type III domain-containing protein, partial [Thermoplasmata archaeon]